MKNLIRLAIVAGFVLLQNCASSSNSGTTSNPRTNSLSFSPSASDNYEVHWTGTSGNQLYGGYSIISEDINTPMRLESVQATLPHKVNFSVPKNAIVSASGDTLNQGKVEIKIYKNGSECGKVVVVGSGVGANKVCQ
ncbi:MAG: hypothetical protein NWQ28_11905 [Nodularia sp. (in: cyanobacteria)]|nr:hypothetical protein [Nodularia sp. (in: cyanobacteria)]